MKYIAIIFIAFISIHATRVEQTSGIYNTLEDYQSKKFSSTDEFASASWTVGVGEVIKFKRNGGGKYKLDLATVWGYKDDKGRDHRICDYKDKKKTFVILKNATLCVYGFMYSDRAEDEKGNLIQISTHDGKKDFFISKSITGELERLNEENLQKMVEDQPKIVDAIVAEKFGKKNSLDLLSIINVYNMVSKKK